MPATRIETVPPPEGAATDQVDRPYVVSSPNSMDTVEPAGAVKVYFATRGLLVGATEEENPAKFDGVGMTVS